MLALGLNAQLERTGTPVSWNQQLSIPIANEWLGEANVVGLMAEDAAHVEDRSVPYRFAFARSVSWSMQNSGSWVNLENGDRLWILGVSYANAFSIALTLGNLQMPQGGRLYVYSDDRLDYMGPLTYEDNRQGELGLPHVRGERIFLEYYEPRNSRGQGQLEVAFVSGAYRTPLTEAIPMQSCALWHADAPQSVREARVSSSLIRILTDHGQRYATGVLLNNSLNNAEPYVIVPSEVISGSVSSMVFQFGLDDMDCLLQNSGCPLQTICGAEVVTVDAASGLALLKLHKAPPAEWNAYYAGWAIENTSGLTRYCLQHPKGLAKSYSKYQGSFIPVVQEEEITMGLAGVGNGQSDAGSVGSPLLDADWNVVGVFVGGNSRCSSQGGMDEFVLLEDVWLTFKAFLDPILSSAERMPGMETPNLQPVFNETNQLVLYPNPARNFIQFAGIDDLNLQEVEIYDALGRLRLQFIAASKLDISALEDGIYTVKVISASDIFTRSLLVTKK
jgi:hypothetical protein